MATIDDLIAKIRRRIIVGGGYVEMSEDDLETLIAAIPQAEKLTDSPKSGGAA